MKIIISGATGFIGKNLVEKISKIKKFEIICLVRKTSNKKDIVFLKKHNVIIIYGDITKKKEINSLKNEFDNSDIIIHLAGILGKFNIKKKEYHKINVIGTKNLIGICKKQKFIYCSTAGVLGKIENGNEKSKPSPTNIYEKSKLEGEKIVKKYNNYVILRPGLIYGKYDKHLLPLFNSIKEKKFFLLGNGNSKIQPTYVDDLINCLIYSVNKKIKNQYYLITGEKPITIKYFTLTIAKYCKVNLNKIKIPLFVAKLYVILTERICQKLKINQILTKSRLDFFTISRTFNNEKAKKELNFKPNNFEIGFKKTINWYMKKKLL